MGVSGGGVHRPNVVSAGVNIVTTGKEPAGALRAVLTLLPNDFTAPHKIPGVTPSTRSQFLFFALTFSNSARLSLLVGMETWAVFLLLSPFFSLRSRLPGLGVRLPPPPPPPSSPRFGEFFLGDFPFFPLARSARMRAASACSRTCSFLVKKGRGTVSRQVSVERCLLG